VAGPDAASDAGPDAGPDAGSDAGPNGASDAGPDAGPEGTPATPPARRRGHHTVAVAVTAALIGAAVGGGVGATVAWHLGRHPAVTVVRETVPAPDRVASINDIPTILARAEPSIVAIATDQGSGSGIVIAAGGQVVTNYHVVAGADYIHVMVFHRAGYQTARVVGYDQTDDVALIHVDNPANLPAAALGDSSQLQVGSDVVAVGNALDLPGGPSVTSGIVSALGRSIDPSELPAGASEPPNLIQTDAALNPGNSGGPLLDADGDVVGLNTLVIQTLGFAIPIDTVKGLLPALSAGSKAATADLGIGMQDNNAQLASEYGIAVTTGTLVSSVAPGSPAEQAGLQAYDVILSFGGQPVADSAQLIALIAGHPPGVVVALSVVRGSRTLRFNVTLAHGTAPP
jgi:serine protease Do